ncbi:hypothetical protein GQ457_14G008490 [Hibiscus cannabinus]
MMEPSQPPAEPFHHPKHHYCCHYLHSIFISLSASSSSSSLSHPFPSLRDFFAATGNCIAVHPCLPLSGLAIFVVFLLPLAMCLLLLVHNFCTNKMENLSHPCPTLASSLGDVSAI